MNRIAPLLPFVLCGTLFGQQQIFFSGLSLRVGQTFVRTSGYKMNVDVVLKFAGDTLGEYNNNTTTTLRKSETVLAMNGDAITKVKVKYEAVDHKSVITEDGIPENKNTDKSPVLLRTYIVWVENGVVKVTDVHGLKPSAEEVELVQDDYEELG